MELHCLQSRTVSSIPQKVLVEKPFLHGQSIFKFPSNKRSFPDRRRLRFHDCRAQLSGTAKIKPQAQDAATSNGSQKDGNLVFVAGATGRVGSRTVRELLKLGFKVRAGVRSIPRAESLVQSVRNMKLEDAGEGTKPIDKLELVECDLEKPEQIGAGIGNSSIVICCIGASEKEVFDITGPYRIDYQATKNLIDAATSAKVDHFILLTSLGTNKFGFPAAILNLFWGVLSWKRRAEEALLASGLPYTIVRPGGMERPTDSYKETHNITLSEGDTLFGGQVSNLQVAELMAFMAKNGSLSYCKVVEVIAETTAPLTPMGDLLQKIPSQREEVYTSKEADDADGSQPVAVPDSTYTEKEPEQVKAPAATPLSPYIAYEDLKPPTSPTPTPSTGSSATVASKIEITPTAASSTSSPTEVNSSEIPTVPIENAIPQTAPKKISASSPYINYEDLKPPTSPTPTASTGSRPTESSKIEIKPTAASSTSSSTEVNSSEIPTVPIENVIPQTAPKKVSASSPYINYEDLKPPTSPTPTPSTGSAATKDINIDILPGPTSSTSSSVDINSSETPSIAIENATPQIAPKRTHASSPYINYEDLKPPTSPTPTPSTSSGTTEASNIEVKPTATSSISPSLEVNSSESSVVIENASPQIAPKRTTASSPYINYEDLKPPSSPTPTPSGTQKKPSIAPTSTEVGPEVTVGNDVAVGTTDSAKALTSDQSPYLAYEETKPPSSPSPSVPTFSSNDKPENPVDVDEKEHHVQSKDTPLSPYTMYEDLKPPSSPTPSSP